MGSKGDGDMKEVLYPQIETIEKPKEKITPKEFMKRWGQGIKDITPSQMNIINIQGNVLVIVGIIIGLCVTFNGTWWLFIILLGSLFITFMALLGSIQKQLILNEFKRATQGGIK